uniref:heavy metal translocating P-type ATPase n=1 Tax=Nocardioides alcanivorans TaxID=2897352 RepID=UPI001F2AFC19
MSAACGCDEPSTPAVDGAEDPARPWWRDRGLLIPIFSGIAFVVGLALEWSSLETAASLMFWLGLLLGAYTFVPGAIRNLIKRKLGIALLMTISAVGAVLLGYVEEAAALAFLYSIAEALEDKAMDRARGGLRALLKLVPETATVVRDGSMGEVPVREILVGQVMVVGPGERVATDGVVRAGRSSLDTSAITGESIPVEVEPGDEISAGAINTAGVLEVETTAAGTDNSLTTIVELVEQAQTEKGDRARVADRIARPLVPGVMILAVLVGAIGSLFGDPELWITRALVVLVAASPCALAIAVPVTVISAIGAASKFGVIIKSGAAFERLGGIRHLAVDKTGTLTRNQPTVTTVIPTAGTSEDTLLAYAAAVERHSTHPLATAITTAADAVLMAQDVSEEAGHGISGIVDGHRVTVGSPRWIDPGPLAARVQSLESDGQTCVLVTIDGLVAGVIGVRDELRPEVPEVVATLNRQGIEV